MPLSFLILLPGSAMAEAGNGAPKAYSAASPLASDGWELANHNGLKFSYTEKTGVVCMGLADGADMTEVNIPDYVAGKPVKAIGASAFQSQNVESVTIPSTVTDISSFAFQGCTSLTSVTIAEGSQLKTIGWQAFNKSSIKSITIPSTVTEIASFAFDSCEKLTSVTFAEDSQLESIGAYAFECVPIESITIPSTMKTIGKGAFGACTSLSSVTIAEGSQLETIGNNAFYNTAIKNLSIPSTMKTIGGSAFAQCSSLTSVTFAEDSQLETIGDNAFANTAIESLNIPSSVKTMGGSICTGCKSLTSLTFNRITWNGDASQGIQGNDLEGYDSNLGSNLNDVLTIYVPAGCEDVYQAKLSDYTVRIEEQPIVSDDLKYAVSNTKDGLVCNGFSDKPQDELVIPDMVHGIPVTVIGEKAFHYDRYVTSISIPSTVKEIGKDAFSVCLGLEKLSIADGSQLTTISQGAFVNCQALADIVIPSSVKTIGVGAFTDCQALTSIVIPSSVETIGDNAFFECSKLASLTFQRIPTAENGISGYSDSMLGEAKKENLSIIVPEEAVEAYKTHLSTVASSIMADGGQLKLTDEAGLVCEGKTLCRAGNLSYERTLDAPGEYATLCLPFSLNLANTHGIFDKVYVPMNTLIHNTAKSTSELEHFVLMLEEQASDAIIPAGQPIFVRMSDTAEKMALQNYEDEILTADLQPKTEAMKVVDWDGTSGLMTQNKQFSISYGSLYQPKADVSADDHIWSFNANGSFGPQTSGTMPPFRLFLTVGENAPTVQAKTYSISIGVSDGTTTGIREILSSDDAISTSKPNASSAYAGIIYDLNGRKVATASEAQHLSKGIYILNGKKMVVK